MARLEPILDAPQPRRRPTCWSSTDAVNAVAPPCLRVGSSVLRKLISLLKGSDLCGAMELPKTPDERFSPAICTKPLRSITSENARHTSGYACAFPKHWSLKLLAHPIRQNRSSLECVNTLSGINNIPDDEVRTSIAARGEGHVGAEEEAQQQLRPRLRTAAQSLGRHWTATNAGEERSSSKLRLR